MFLLKNWVVNVGSTLLGIVAWLNHENIIIFTICITGIMVWNYSQGLHEKKEMEGE